MSRLLLLLGLSWRTRLRGFASAGASSIFLVMGGLFYLAFTCAMGVGAYFVLSQSRGGRVERFADIASLVVTMFGVFFLTRPLIFTNLSGSSLQNLLHLPIRRRELLVYSLLTGVVTPLLLESPVLIGAGLGAASNPALLLLTLPLALLSHLTLLAGAHAMSLFAVLIARRTWIADLARVLAFAIFFLPSLLNYRSVREFLRPLVGRPDVELIVRSGNIRDLLAQLEAHAVDVVLANSAAPRNARVSGRGRPTRLTGCSSSR